MPSPLPPDIAAIRARCEAADIPALLAHIDELTAALAAEQGEAAGAISDEWAYAGNGAHVASNPWNADYDYPYSGTVSRIGAGLYYWSVDKRHEGYLTFQKEGRAATARDAMRDCDTAHTAMRTVTK